MPISERQLAANRANARKSTGPVTAEGKARSAANARVLHGLASPERATQSLCLSNENRGELETLYRCFVEEFEPATPSELCLVHELAACRWRAQRALAFEKALLENQMDDMHDDLARTFESISPATRAGLAFNKLGCSGSSYPLLLRYEARLARQFKATRKLLLEAIELRRRGSYEEPLFADEKVNLQSEPIPKIDHDFNPEQDQSPNNVYQFPGHRNDSLCPEQPASPAEPAEPADAAARPAVPPDGSAPGVASLRPAALSQGPRDLPEPEGALPDSI